MTEANSQISVQVYLGPRSYEIDIVSGRLTSLARHIEPCLDRLPEGHNQPGKALVVTDSHVRQPHGEAVLNSLTNAGWTCRLAEIEPGERFKTLETAAKLFDELVALRADRYSFVVAVGGGVVGDVAGFVAATYARGIPFIQVPTTLLAQVDSAVGGKVAVNHPQGKNLIGAFHQPYAVFVDTATLGTLPDRDYRSGLAEVIKYGVILDDEFFAYLEENVAGLNSRAPDVLRKIVARSCRLKADIVEQDEFELTGIRAALNYGHTFAHAFEAVGEYDQLLHGEAVAVGMLCASRLAAKQGLIPQEVTDRQHALLKAVGLPVSLPANVQWNAAALCERMLLDKKTIGGQLRFVLPVRLGEVQIVKNVPPEDVRDAIESAMP